MSRTQISIIRAFLLMRAIESVRLASVDPMATEAMETCDADKCAKGKKIGREWERERERALESFPL